MFCILTLMIPWASFEQSGSLDTHPFVFGYERSVAIEYRRVMVAPSKLLEPPLNRVHCAILHSLPGQSCTKAFLWNLYRNHVSIAKYYSPLLLVW